MTMHQVSKGEFDRRVKLLEQKVKESTSSLIARLQAESEAFIEKLRNTQLDIESLKNEIDGTETDLDNLVTSFNNYTANTIRISDVFDANGQFDGSKIKPLSIDTAAISVGQRSQQLTLTGVNFAVNDYSSGNGSLVWEGGTMFHYGFGITDASPKLYSIGNGSFNFANGNSYYIYAVFKRVESIDVTYNLIGKISKDYYDECKNSNVLFLDNTGSTAATSYNADTQYYLKQQAERNKSDNDSTAYILVSQSQIDVDGKIHGTSSYFNPSIIPGSGYSSSQKCFYVQLGYVSGTQTGSNGYNYRKVDMTYGQTTINGRLITTGRIEGTTGTNPAYFDLDAGEIGGSVNKITVGSGSSTVGMIKDGTNNVAIWAGSENGSNSSPIYIKKDGSAKFGDLNIASDGILSFKNSSLVIQKSNYSVSFTKDSLERNVTIRSGDYGISEQYIYDSAWNNGWGAATATVDTDWIIVKVNFSGTYNISAYTEGQIIFTVKTEGTDATSSNETISISNLNGSTIKSGTFNKDIYISYNPYYDLGLNKLNFIVTPSRTYGSSSGVVTINTLNIYVKYEFTLCVNAKEGFNIFNNGYTIYKKNARTLVFCGFDNNNVRFIKIVHSDGNSDDNRFIITTTSLIN